MGHYQNGYSRGSNKIWLHKKRMLNKEITQLEKIIDELQTELNEKNNKRKLNIGIKFK